MKIYNTLTRDKVVFEPLEEGKVSMYVCGPTVYDVPHIGHIRSGYVFELVRRYFEYKGYSVLFVRNVTDVDDKIINRAKEELEKEGSEFTPEALKAKAGDISVKYLREYHQAMGKLGVRSPDHEPKATENIPEMIDFIQRLIDKDSAYVVDNDVYFSVKDFPEYGKLSGQDIDQMKSNVRISSDEKKKDPLDFALWKGAKEGEPFWESPWGTGRPGWHIECSVMSTNILGHEFDIHGGGLDLIFPHHENEIAQAKANTGSDFAKIWMHNGFLTVNGEKMSKSLKNYITVDDYINEYGDVDLLKVMFLSSHYRSPVDFTKGKIEEASKAKERVMIFLRKVEQRNAHKVDPSCDDPTTELMAKFTRAMDDDLNTPVALSVVFDAVHLGNKLLEDEKVDQAMLVRKFVLELGHVFGIDFSQQDVDDSEVRDIESLIKDREEARKNKQFDVADEIRDKLSNMGVILEDSPKGTLWRKN